MNTSHSDDAEATSSRSTSVSMKTAVLAALSLALNLYFGYALWSKPTSVLVSQASAERLVMRTPGGLLEVSTIKAEERFDSTTEHTVLGVSLGRTIAQVRVPTVYRYQLPLARDWTFRLTGNTLIVVAPRVMPSLPVAIDTGKLEAFSSGAWSPITGADAIASLQKSITAKLGEKAASQEMLLLQRESARLTVGEFVRKWVVEQARWKGSKTPTVFVFFEDEPLGKQAVPLLSDMQ